MYLLVSFWTGRSCRLGVEDESRRRPPLAGARPAPLPAQRVVWRDAGRRKRHPMGARRPGDPGARTSLSGSMWPQAARSRRARRAGRGARPIERAEGGARPASTPPGACGT